MAQINTGDLLLTATEKFQEGEYHVAEVLLNQALLHNKKRPEVFYMLGTIYYDKGQFNKAIKAYRRSLELDPAYTDASVGLSIILNDLGRYDEGRHTFEAAKNILAEKDSRRDPYVEERLAIKHDELGQLYFQNKRFDEALEQFYKALNLSTRKAELTMKVVECFVQKKGYPRAIKELKHLIKEYPQFASARIKLGLIFYEANQVIDAVEQWESVLLRDPEHPEAHKFIQMAQETGLAHLI